MRDALHFGGKGDGVFVDGLKEAVDSGVGNVRYLFKLVGQWGVGIDVAKRTIGWNFQDKTGKHIQSRLNARSIIHTKN